MFFLKKFIKFGSGAAAKKFKDTEKPFLEHLEDLRGTLMKVVGTLVISTIVAFVFYKQLIDIINYPVEQAGYDSRLLVLSPFEGFMSVLKICLYAGLIFSFPLILYFIGEFVIPGLNEKEKKLIIPVVLISFLLFASGVLFSYFVVIPRALEFFDVFNERVGIDTQLRFKYTVSFVTMLSLVFGLCFELPVVVMSLVKLDLLNSQMMRSTRSYAIVIMFVLSAVITPTPDIFTMSLLAGPMVLLYELCIWMAWWLERKTAKREELEREEERKALVKSMEMQKKREKAKEVQSTDGPAAVSGTREYDPENEAVYHDETGDDPKDESAAFDEYHTGLQDDSSPVDPTSDAVWNQGTGEESASDSGHDHDADHYDHHDHHDPYHYDHGYHDDGYYSGPTEELKRSLREDLKTELKEDLKAELKAELKSEIIKELKQAMEDDKQEDSS
ncbi:MAG: twin-arginine translocase subunit TatC [Verrucomicrobiota bacterium]|nr:twin-arginine translocase subunit TatC [Verrucomicrobiota bacterium]